MKNLEQSLLNARKFMDHSAMNKRSGNRNISTPPTQPTVNNLQEAQLPNVGVPTSTQPNMNPKANMSKESIMNSRLPDAIKKAMIETPIPDVNPTPQLSESFVDKVSKKMNSQEYSVQNMRNTANSNVNASIPTQQSTDPIPPIGSNDLDKNTLKSTIKECIREILKEEKVLMESTNIKENLQLRVGNKLFTGNIKSVKTIK
tara:strand:+ start:708 stop:1313 length:606 start_codon:yes stop_codon:yes gene_type:complete